MFRMEGGAIYNILSACSKISACAMESTLWAFAIVLPRWSSANFALNPLNVPQPPGVR